MSTSNRFLAAGFFLFVLTWTAFVPANELSQKANIILILADDLGYECVGANGGKSYKTPNLDRMAREGVRFEHCYAQPNCTPTRVQLMTGLSNVRNYVDFGTLEKSQTTFGHILRKAGYATCIAGKWQLGSRDASLPKHFGFDEHCLWAHMGRGERANQTAHLGKRGAVEQVFDHQFKLYSTGEFFELARDPDEHAAIPIANLTGEAAAAASRFEKVLGQLENARPPHLKAPRAPVDKKGKKKK